MKPGPVLRALCVLVLTLTSHACGASEPTVTNPPAPESRSPFHLEGRVTFAARQATATGASSATEERPARHVHVEAHGASGGLATASTDDDGHYVLDGAFDVQTVEVMAQLDVDGRRLSVAYDELGTRLHAQTFQVPPLAERAGWDGHLSADADSALGGALHILDTLARGYRTVERWTGQRLPELYVYWGPDVTVDWSYYRGARGPDRFCLELLAGRRSERATTDTDEHDEAIILHELGHFVFDRFTTHSSIGGRHPRGSRVDPGVAWEEGRATWLATAIRDDPAYIDSRGIEGTGSARVDETVETPQPPRGVGSETSVAGVLWDLADGAPDPRAPDLELSVDTDADGLAIGPAAVLRGMISAAHAPSAYPALASFLRHLVASGVVAEPALRAMLRSSGEPEAVLDEAWPIDLALGTTVTGHIDGVTQPAPSGGENRAENGYDAVRAYRIVIVTPGTLVLTLTPSGSGSVVDHTDLTLELRNDRADVVGRSASGAGAETLTLPIARGTYVAYARDAGGGALADFTLSAALTP